MRRTSGLVLVGLGAFFVTAALLLRFFVLPNLLVTPIDQFAESFARGTGTVFNPATLEEETGVALVAHRTLRGDVAASSKDVGVWDQSLLLERDETGELVNAYTDRVAWDRKTGEAVNCCGEAVDGEPVKHVGLSYKFPFDTEKKTYQFFDVTARKAFPMKYQASEELQGLTVYRFEQVVPPQQIGESDVPGSLVGSDEATVTAPRYYDNVRTVWVEPLSGVIVKGAEQQHQVFRDEAGADAVTLIEVTLTFDERTQKQQADLAKDARSKAGLVGTWIPLALLVLGLVLIGLAVPRLRGDAGDRAGTDGSRRRDPVKV
jgi:Porin PorA